MKVNSEHIGNMCIFLAFLMAYFARSIFAGVLFGSITLPIFYILTYGCYLLTLFLRHEKLNGYFPWLIAIGTVMLFGMYRTGDLSAIRRYSIVLLLPLVLPSRIIMSKNWAYYFLIVTIFVSIGCIFGHLFPEIYQSTILPLFQGRDYKSISFVLSEGGQGGFISQSGYASFFLSMGLGALFCFRDIIIKRRTCIILAILFLYGLLITQKRSPVIMFFVAILIVIYLEGKGGERFKRFFYIVVALIGIYAILSVLVTIGVSIPGIERVYTTIHGLISGDGVNDTGRMQLYTQAVVYFREHPLIGIGWTNYKNLFLLRKTHVHNIYLQLLCETGIIGFLVFLAFFITNLINTCKLLNEYRIENSGSVPYAWIKYSLYVQVFFLLFGITENPLYDTEDVMIYFFVVGIINVLSTRVVKITGVPKRKKLANNQGYL